jgi:hypothetical protein
MALYVDLVPCYDCSYLARRVPLRERYIARQVKSLPSAEYYSHYYWQRSWESCVRILTRTPVAKGDDVAGLAGTGGASPQRYPWLEEELLRIG